MSKDIKEVEKEIIEHIGGFIVDIKTTSKLINKSPSTLSKWGEEAIYLNW